MTTRTLALFAAIALSAGAAAADLPAPVPGSEATLLQRAEIMAARQSWGDAAAAYRAAVAAQPDDAQLHNRLGICYERLGDAKAARKAYRRAIELRKDYAEAWNNVGTLDHARGKHKQAIAAYGRAIQAKPQDPVFYRNLGAAWLAKGDIAKALEAWGEAFRLDPASFDEDALKMQVTDVSPARQYYLYAKLLAARGDVEKALDFLAKAHDAGFAEFAKVETDRDFAALVSDPRYAALK
jgi:tetratricopeptide (TPR) repeat protein